jgi:hypothetical protein
MKLMPKKSRAIARESIVINSWNFFNTPLVSQGVFYLGQRYQSERKNVTPKRIIADTFSTIAHAH